ncbi:hypothetical protein [Pararhizobium sp. PWRC1-1]|uniref:hypothetical protein n=1 Tax=Pararhizobium sp. PWRC1-1 TaxID=2804566 RepID=UPI003CF9B16B
MTGNEELYGESANMTNGATAANGFYYRLNFYTAAMVFVSSIDILANISIPASMLTRSGTVTVPSTARFALVQIFNHSSNTTASNLIIDRLVLRRKKAGSLIVDGSITADKLNVNDLSAISATLGSVNISSAIIGSLQVGTSNIQAGAVTGFAAGAIATGALDGSRTVDIVLTHPDSAVTPGMLVKVEIYCYISAFNASGGASGTWVLGLTNVTSGANLGVVQQTTLASGTGTLSFFGYFTPAAGVTSTTIRATVTLRGTVNANAVFATCFKK